MRERGGVVRRARRAARSNETGFTLIELLVVIIILGILSAVVVFAVRGAGDKGKAAAFTTDEKTIRTAEEAFCAKNGYYGDVNDLVSGKFLSEAPTYHTVTPGPGGTCTGGGDHVSRTGFSMPCADSQACSTITIAMPSDGNNKNNIGQWTPSPTGIFETLTQLNPDYSISPLMAASWDIIDKASSGGQKLVNGVPSGPRLKTDPAACAAPDNPGPGGFAFSTGTGTDPACSPFPGSHTFRFHIRTSNAAGQRITYHDGVPLTALTVKLGVFDRLGRGTFFNQTVASQPDSQNDSGQVIDNTCTNADNCLVDFTPYQDNLRVPEQMTHPGNTSLESPNQIYFPGGSCFHFNPDTGAKVFDSGCTDNSTAHPIGTGPFTFVSWSQGVSLEVTRNAGWWQGKAAAKTLKFLYTSDSNTRNSLLTAGQADLLYWARPDDVTPLQGAGFRLTSPPTPGDYYTLWENVHPDALPNAYDCRATGWTPAKECHDLLTDLNMRKAVALGIDRNAVLALFGGQGSTKQTFVPPALLRGHAGDVTGFSLDRTQAGTLLDAAGWTSNWTPGATTCTPVADTCRKNSAGRELRLTLVNPPGQTGSTLSQLLQSQLQQVGVGVTIKAPVGSDVGNGQFDLYLEASDSSTDGNPAHGPRQYLYTDCTPSSPPPCTGVAGPTPGYTPGSTVGAGFSPPGSYSQYYGLTPGSFNKRSGPDAPANAMIDGAFADLTDDQAAADIASAVHAAVDTYVTTIPLGSFQRLYFTKGTITGFTPHPNYVSQSWATVAKTGP